MRKKLYWVVLALLLIGVLIGAGALYKKLSAETAPEILQADTAQSDTDGTSAPVGRTTELPTQTTEPERQTAAAAETAAPEKKTEPDRELAPDFTVYTADGSPVTLSSQFGKPVVVNFWATWCGPCRQELSGFDKAAEAYDGEIGFMMVNLTDGRSETVEGVQTFVRENGYTFPVYFDTQSSAANAYPSQYIPVTVFIAADGTVQRTYTGSLTETMLNAFLAELRQ